MKIHLLTTSLVIGIGLLFAATPVLAANKNLTFGVNPWPENIAVAHLWQQLLDKRGYKVKLQTGGKAPIWAGVANGKLNLDFEAWLPHGDGAYYRRFKKNLTTIGPWFENAREGFVVPDYLDVKSIPQLKARASNFERHGQPTIVGIGAGAGVTLLAHKAIKRYSLPFKLQTSSGAAMNAELKRAYAAHKPIVVTLWKPHWAWAKYHLHFLKDPKRMFGKPDGIYIFAHRGFKDAYPKVTAWLSHFKLNSEQLAHLMNLVYHSNKADQAVAQWRKKHASLIKTWFKPR